MELASYLRNPIILDHDVDVGQIKQRLQLGEHPFVFVERNGELYALNSISLLLEFERKAQVRFSLARLINSSPIKIIPLPELSAHVLDVLSQEVTLVRHREELKYFRREDYLLAMTASGTDTDHAWLRALFSSIPKGLMIVDFRYAVVNTNEETLRMLKMSRHQLAKASVQELFGTHHFEHVKSTQTPLLNQVITLVKKTTVLVDFVPLMMNRAMTGFALVLQDLPSVEAMAMELDSVKDLNQDLEAILSTIYDEIVVVDARGVLVRASAHFIAGQWQHPPNSLIGARILEYKSADDVMCRVFTDVQRKKQKVSLMGTGSDPILCVGNPIFTDHRELERVVIASRDLSEVSQLQRELEKTRKQGETYRQQIEWLQKQINHIPGSVVVYASPLMDEVMQEVQRVAQFAATVLIVGESGVGKEVIADLIHSLGERRSNPFIKINCAAIPETLLESELFGYEKGAFSGADRQGKKGLFIKAHKGTLFLDEISELPLGLQAKLLRALQEREVYPVGGTTPIKFDAHIIAATNRSLLSLVAQGKFREDLFYRIDVYPIEVPPLRDRREDIGVLANHYLHQFNQTYQRNLRFSSSAIELLEAYDFPGNVRELQNIVQRLAIRNDTDVIDVPVVERIVLHAGAAEGKKQPRNVQIVPLKQALEKVENEMIALAMKRYHSTTQAARALGVSQSTVSRKYSQMRDKVQATPSVGK